MMSELVNSSYDAGLEQIIIELLSKSHQEPQSMSNTNFQSRIINIKPLKVSIIFLFYGVITSHTLNTPYHYDIHSIYFSWKGGLIRVKL